MKIIAVSINSRTYPKQLLTLSDPPKQLYYLGTPPVELLQRPALAVVGSRKASAYGKQVTNSITSELARQGVVIISGLALGTDAIAHQAALNAGGTTIAVLPCGLNTIYPASNRQLARNILQSGGTLLTEYPEGTDPHKYHFIARNRIVAGLSTGVLIPEAAEHSGSLHTASFALDQGKTVMAIPGPITSPTSTGTHALIRSGAALIISAQDVLDELGLRLQTQQQTAMAFSNEEAAIIQLLEQGINTSTELITASKLPVPVFHQTLTLLEINGSIKPAGPGTWILKR